MRRGVARGLETMEPTEGKAKGSYESELNDWINHEKAAIDLIGIIGKLWFEKSIELSYRSMLKLRMLFSFSCNIF